MILNCAEHLFFSRMWPAFIMFCHEAITFSYMISFTCCLWILKLPLQYLVNSRQSENFLYTYAHDKFAEQPTNLCSLINVYVFWYLERFLYQKFKHPSNLNSWEVLPCQKCHRLCFSKKRLKPAWNTHQHLNLIWDSKYCYFWLSILLIYYFLEKICFFLNCSKVIYTKNIIQKSINSKNDIHFSKWKVIYKLNAFFRD